MQTANDLFNKLLKAVSRMPGDAVLDPLRPQATILRDNTRKHHDKAASNLIEATQKLQVLYKTADYLNKQADNSAEKEGSPNPKSQHEILKNSKPQIDNLLEFCMDLYALETLVWDKYDKANYQRAVFSGAPKDHPLNKVLEVGKACVAELEKLEPTAKLFAKESDEILSQGTKLTSILYDTCIRGLTATATATAAAQNTTAAEPSINEQEKVRTLLKLIGEDHQLFLKSIETTPAHFVGFTDQQQPLRDAASKKLRTTALSYLMTVSVKLLEPQTAAELQKKIEEKKVKFADRVTRELANTIADPKVRSETQIVIEKNASASTSAAASANPPAITHQLNREISQNTAAASQNSQTATEADASTKQKAGL